MTLARKRLVASIAGLAVYAILAVASFAPAALPPVTIASIVRGVQLTQGFMKAAKLLSAATSNSLDDAYTELAERLRAGDLSAGSIQEMEATHARLRAEADTLGWTLASTRTSANELFEMLERRAKENSTPELQRLMISNINANQHLFDEQVGRAENAMTHINASIQKYDDILGFLQVSAGLDQVNRYISEIEAVLGQAEALDQEIQTAIDQGMEIVEGYRTAV